MRGLTSSNPYRLVGIVAFIAMPSLSYAQGGGTQAWPAAPQLPANIEVVVNRFLDSARTRGLPTSPLTSKAAEGVLKGADSARIVSAVRKLFDELDSARKTLGPSAPSAELVAAASALHAGVTPAQLAHVAQLGSGQGKSERLVMPLVVLADLVARRVSTDVAVASLETLLARAAPDAEYATLRTAIERDIANGKSPDAAMRAQSAAVVRTLDAKAGGVRPPEE
ncbi:MAG TPA: hypothetical protein VGQ44_19435 [Gemmatimonadaceae bacterium]|jgi:hypothetical protein|nr:hypothetical protein [Gemmatimonadaceae bacterium]